MKAFKRRGRAPVLAAGAELGCWKLIECIGAGGNGTVWRASKDDSSECAIKILKKLDMTSYSRFKAEVKALSLVKGMAGVIPMLESDLPDKVASGLRWFAMPLAKPFESFVTGMKPIEVVREFILLAETLSQLHRLEIYHRDIKPANLLVLDGRLCFRISASSNFRREEISRR